MNNYEQIIDCIRNAIASIPDVQIGREITEDLVLFGPDSPFDSLAKVNVIIAVESEVEETFGQSVSLVEANLTGTAPDAKTMKQLADLLAGILK